jgi:hypothetical protein
MPVTHRGRFNTHDGDYVYVDSQDKLGVTVELLHWDKKQGYLPCSRLSVLLPSFTK